MIEMDSQIPNGITSFKKKHYLYCKEIAKFNFKSKNYDSTFRYIKFEAIFETRIL